MKYYKSISMKGHPRADKNGMVLKHIVVAEKKIGRQISCEEVVHHIDGNKRNNNPDNLMVFASKEDHALFHHGGIAYKKCDVWICKRLNTKVICKNCEKVFLLPAGRKIRDNLFCSKKCFYEYRSQIKSTTDEIITALKNAKGNFSEVGRQFKVTPNAIIKKLKTNNLPYHSRDYK
jgi:hypothetical protein